MENNSREFSSSAANAGSQTFSSGGPGGGFGGSAANAGGKFVVILTLR